MNPVTLQYDTPPAATVIHSGPGLWRTLSEADRVDIAGDIHAVADVSVFLPYDATPPEPDDVVTCQAAGFNSSLVGQVAVVLASEQDSYLTRWRVLCRLDQGGGAGP